MIQIRLPLPEEAQDITAPMMAVDPGLTTGLAFVTNDRGPLAFIDDDTLSSTWLQVWEVGVDEWIEATRFFPAAPRLVTESYTVRGARSRDAAAALRTSGIVEGFMLGWVGEGLECREQSPTARYPFMRRATELLAGTDLAHSQHAKDALAHLLLAVKTWR